MSMNSALSHFRSLGTMNNLLTKVSLIEYRYSLENEASMFVYAYMT